MSWTEIITLIISSLTLVMVVVELFVNTREKHIDRQIDIIIKEHKKMQQELFKNIIGILEINRMIEYENFLKDKNVLFNDILNYKISVWINLNNRNKFANELRENCNGLVTLVASFLDKYDIKESKMYLTNSNLYRQKIWKLIDKYINEEELLNKYIITGNYKNKISM